MQQKKVSSCRIAPALHGNDESKGDELYWKSSAIIEAWQPQRRSLSEVSGMRQAGHRWEHISGP